jgi:hypothetical protein
MGNKLKPARRRRETRIAEKWIKEMDEATIAFLQEQGPKRGHYFSALHDWEDANCRFIAEGIEDTDLCNSIGDEFDRLFGEKFGYREDLFLRDLNALLEKHCTKGLGKAGRLKVVLAIDAEGNGFHELSGIELGDDHIILWPGHEAWDG